MAELMKTMTFHDGKVIVDDPNGISYIGPCSNTLSQEDLMALMKEHGFITEDEEND